MTKLQPRLQVSVVVPIEAALNGQVIRIYFVPDPVLRLRLKLVIVELNAEGSRPSSRGEEDRGCLISDLSARLKQRWFVASVL